MEFAIGLFYLFIVVLVWQIAKVLDKTTQQMNNALEQKIIFVCNYRQKLTLKRLTSINFDSYKNFHICAG